MGIGFTFLLMIMLAGFAWFRADMQTLKVDMDRRFVEQKVEIDRRFTEQKAEMDRRFDKMEKLIMHRR